MAYRTAQVGNLLGLKARSIQKMILDGYLKAHKHADGIHWLIEKEDLADFIAGNKHYYRKFLAQNPQDRYRVSYDILLREVQKRYVD